MANWWESAKSIAKNAYCEVAEFGEWYAGGVATLLDETKLDELAEFQLEYAQWANRKFCGKSPSSSIPSYLEPAFSGGQCSGTAYGINLKIDYVDIPQFPINIGNGGEIIGAIKSIDVNPANGSITVIHNNGNSTYNSGGRNVPNTGFSVTNLYLPFGGSDNCGSLSPAIPPNSAPLVIVRDIDYGDENGVPQTDEDVTFTFYTPVKESDGTISIPYTICKDGFCVKGKVNLGDELVATDDSPSEEYLLPIVELDDPVGDGADTPESELDGEELSEADKEKTPILGVFVKAQKDGLKSKATEVFLEDDAPAILVPNIGYVRFRILQGDESGWLADIPIKSVNAYIPVPDKMEAVSCEVAFQSGWKGKYIVHRGKACCKECEESDD